MRWCAKIDKYEICYHHHHHHHHHHHGEVLMETRRLCVNCGRVYQPSQLGRRGRFSQEQNVPNSPNKQILSSKKRQLWSLPPYGNFDITSQSITTALRLFNLVSKPGKKIKKEKIKHVKVLFVLHVQISGVTGSGNTKLVSFGQRHKPIGNLWGHQGLQRIDHQIS